MKYEIYALLVAATLAAPGAYAKAKKSEKQADAKAEKKANAKPKVVTKEDGLVIEDIKLGDGIEAKEGSRVKVHYFDSEQFETAGTAALERMDIDTLAGEVRDAWYNQTLTRVNDSVVRLGVMTGEYHWHQHDADEAEADRGPPLLPRDRGKGAL